MARITIEDLPEFEALTQAEKEALFGAGARRFRPTMEGLEERFLMTAGLTLATGPPVAHGTVVADSGHANQVQVSYGALDKAAPSSAAIQDSDLATIEQALGQHRAVNAVTGPNASRTDPSLVANRYYKVVGVVHDGGNAFVRVYYTNARDVECSKTISWGQFKSAFQQLTVTNQAASRITATLDASGVLHIDTPDSDITLGGVQYKGSFSLEGMDINFNGKKVSSVDARLVRRIEVRAGEFMMLNRHDIRLEGLQGVDVAVYAANQQTTGDGGVLITPERVPWGLVNSRTGVVGNYHFTNPQMKHVPPPYMQ